MIDPLQNMLQQASLTITPFPPTSRYYGIATSRLETGSGGPTVYLRRRFIPPPDRFSLIQEHSVTEGERPDNISQQYLGDPEQFWQLCDANGVMHPNELTDTAGRKIRITMPEGIPGNDYA